MKTRETVEWVYSSNTTSGDFASSTVSRLSGPFVFRPEGFRYTGVTNLSSFVGTGKGETQVGSPNVRSSYRRRSVEGPWVTFGT